MTASALRIVALLACMAAAQAAQQPAQQDLDDVSVAAPEERERKRAPATTLRNPNQVAVALQERLSVNLRVVKEQTQVVFRRDSAARRLPEIGNQWGGVELQLELLPDRIIALEKPWIRGVTYLLDANIDEVDGMPAHIPFGPGAALVNLEYLGLRDSDHEMSISLLNAMHPQTRQCERTIAVGEFWQPGTNPYVLVGSSMRNCASTVDAREGDLLFAAGVPAGLRQAVQELYDPIASRLANRLGSEPGNIFIAWWEGSPHEGYHFKQGWSRNGLLLLHGNAWQQGMDIVQRESLRMSFMRELIQRRIRETDWPGPFTQSAVSYLLALTRSEEGQATARRLRQELPVWISGCAGRLQARPDSAQRGRDVSSIECGLVLQFVYDAVARAGSAGRESIYDTWRGLLAVSFRRGESGATPAQFLDSSTEARRIALGLVEGSIDWPQFAAALDGIGVKLRAVAGGPPAAFEVQSLKYFED